MKKKIRKERELRPTLQTSWLGGGPRPIILLKTLGIKNLISHGMFWNNMDSAKLAILEHAEVSGKRVSFKPESNRLRAFCSKSNSISDPCLFSVNVRYGEQCISGDGTMRFG